MAWNSRRLEIIDTTIVDSPEREDDDGGASNHDGDFEVERDVQA